MGGFRLGGRDGPCSWQSCRTRLGSLDFMGKQSEVTVLLEDGEVRPVFKAALHWGGETACWDLHQAPLTVSDEGLGRRWWGVQGPELDISAGLGDSE